jgi:hypothetical protein
MPKLPGFCGGSYQSRSIIADVQRVINLYPESSGEKNKFVLYGTPGYSLWSALVDYPVRQFCLTRGRLFVVAGSTLYELFSDVTATKRGNVNPAGTCTISSNGVELFITTTGSAYNYNLASNTLTLLDIPGSLGGVFWEGYFIGLEPGSQTLWRSGQYAGTSWNGLDFQSAEGSPDYTLKIIADHRELIALGQESVEFFSHVNDPDNPLYPNRGAHIEQGIDAPESAFKLDNSVFFIGGGSQGRGIGWRISGYQAQRITTHAIETAWASYSTITDAVGWGYQDEGHSFCVWDFPTAQKTWVYDVATGLFHERGYWDATLGQWKAHKAACHVFSFGKHLIGDRENGNIYQMGLDIYSDNGDEIRRMRVTPHLHAENKRIFSSSLEVHAEMGVGLSTGQGSDPQMMMRYSDDGGKTFGNELWAPLGAIGEHHNRARWFRLGSGRDRVYEISCSEPIKQAWIDAYVD